MHLPFWNQKSDQTRPPEGAMIAGITKQQARAPAVNIVFI
jgi:hypothetical protein